MKAIIWSAFLFFSAIWTCGVALAIALIRAAVDFIRPVEGAAASGVVVQPPIPDWLAPWADLLGWREWIQWATALLESLLTLLPALGQSLDWLVPLAWIIWAIGLIGLLVLTLVASRLTSKLSR